MPSKDTKKKKNSGGLMDYVSGMFSGSKKASASDSDPRFQTGPKHKGNGGGESLADRINWAGKNPKKKRK